MQEGEPKGPEEGSKSRFGHQIIDVDMDRRFGQGVFAA